jgi:hypothetical protein
LHERESPFVNRYARGDRLHTAGCQRASAFAPHRLDTLGQRYQLTRQLLVDVRPRSRSVSIVAATSALSGLDTKKPNHTRLNVAITRAAGPLSRARITHASLGSRHDQ